MNAQILFIVCFSATLAAFGITLVCAGLMMILKSERCSALAELCRADEAQARDPSLVSDGVPLPIEDEPITRPYPTEVYAQVMMQAGSSPANRRALKKA